MKVRTVPDVTEISKVANRLGINVWNKRHVNIAAHICICKINDKRGACLKYIGVTVSKIPIHRLTRYKCIIVDEATSFQYQCHRFYSGGR
jgi:hypothetical protein